MARLPIDLSGMPNSTDVEGMRRWLNGIVSSEGFAHEMARFDIRRRRPARKISKTIVSVKCSDESEDHFDLWVHEPHAEKPDLNLSARPALLMLHGGGWIHGDPTGDERFAEIFASELDAVVIGVDYRLAPENPFPAPLGDCIDGLNWVYKNATNYKIDVNRIGLWGASAGGNLAASLALKFATGATERLNIRLISLVVPVTAHPNVETLYNQQGFPEKSHSEALFADVPPLPERVSREIAELYSLYIGGSTDPCDPFVSPLAAHPTSQHPPTLITIAACDVLRAQGLAYAQLLRSSGVQVTEDILRGVPHSFTFALNANVTKNWLERQIDAFEAAFDIDGVR